MIADSLASADRNARDQHCQDRPAESIRMQVLIALASSSGQLSGVPRHAINLARCLLLRPEVRAVHLVAAPWQQGFLADFAMSCDARLHLHFAPIGKGSIGRNLWYYAELPRLASTLGTDILHLAFPAPIRRDAMPCPTVVTLHDLYPYDIPDNFGFPKVLFNRAVLHQCLSQADAIACVSQCTFSRLKSLNPILAGAKARVVCNSVEQPAAGMPVAGLRILGPHPFLLCVAQHRSNKNIPLALRIFARLLEDRQVLSETRLLIVGIRGPETQRIESFISNYGLVRNVLMLHGISDVELQWCYRNCELLLAPSKLEGFGLPVAEALLAGCRVVCSDIEAFREVGGVYCRYVPLDPDPLRAFVAASVAALRQPRPAPVALPRLAAESIAEDLFVLYRSLSRPSDSHGSTPRPSRFSAEERQRTV